MKVLLVHHSILPDGFVPMGLSILSAVLKKQGHKVQLFDTFNYHHKDKLKNLSPLFLTKVYNPKKDVFKGYIKKLATMKPDLVGFTATTNEVPMIRKLAILTRKHSAAFTVLGGAYATTVPNTAIRIKGINAICIGEGEEAISELLTCLGAGFIPHWIKNMWLRDKGKVYKNSMRLLIDINKLPYMDYDIVDKELLVKPFQGKDYITGQVEMTRGCPYSCAYCINSYLHGLYKGLGKFFRRKNPRRMIDEMKYLKKKYKLQFLRFGDENFLGQPMDSLKEFAKLYKKEVNLPFIMATRPETITEESLKILKTMPCKQVSMGIEHGNEKFRQKVLNRYCTNKSVINAFKLLREYKIRSGAYLMIGFPTETEKLIQDGFNLVLKANPDIVAIYYFRPYENTPLYDLCIEHDLLIKGNVNYFKGSCVKGIHFKRLKKMRDSFYEEFKKRR